MINFYKNLKPENEKYSNPNGKKYNIFHPFRILITGASGSGKTNVLLNLINLLNCFEKYYLFVKLAGDDPLYDNVLIPILEKSGFDIIKKYTDEIDELPDIKDDEIDSDRQNLFVFDDMLDESSKDLKKIESYFTKARKKNCSLVFITQDFFSVPTKIRRNCTHCIFTEINSDNDLQNIYKDLARQDFNSFTEFKKALDSANNRKQPFIIYKKETGNKRYKIGF